MGSKTLEQYIGEAALKTEGDLPIVDAGDMGRINLSDVGGGPTGDVPNATTGTPGKAALATNDQAIAGSDATRIVTPAALHAGAGAVITGRIATDAETTAGTSTTKLVTPASRRADASFWDVRWSGAVGDDIYLNTIFASEGEFEAAFPAAHNVWENWLCRITRTKPGGDDDPNTGSVSSWQNLTLDWAAIQEALETKRNVYIPQLDYVLSDTLLRRLNGSTVEMHGAFYGTRGMSRGNMLGIGEGADMRWSGGHFYGADTLGDNCVTVFQNLVPTATAGWESVNAKRVFVEDMTFHDIPRDPDGTYGGGKGISFQYGFREVVASNMHADNCDIGWSVEGRLSSTPAAGPDPDEPYYGRALTINGFVVKDASLMGCWINNSSNTDDPNAGSVEASGLIFVDCADGQTDLGVICGDRATNVRLRALVVTTDDAVTMTPVRGVWRHGCDLDVAVNSNLYQNVIDTRHPVSHGSNTLGCDGATIRVRARARTASSVNMIRRATGSGGEAPAPANCRFILELDNFTARQIGSTALAATNRIVIDDLTTAVHYENWGTTQNLPSSTGGVYRSIHHQSFITHTSDPSLGNGTVYLVDGSTHDPLGTGGAGPYLVTRTGGSPRSVVPRPRSTTATNIGSAAHAVNTVDKWLGKMVWDSTNTRPLWASGPNATDPWKDATGASAITPA